MVFTLFYSFYRVPHAVSGIRDSVKIVHQVSSTRPNSVAYTNSSSPLAILLNSRTTSSMYST